MRIILVLFCTILLAASNADRKAEHVGYIKQFTQNRNYGSKYAVLIDMSLPSNEKRWFVVDLSSNRVVYEAYVAHGRGSGEGLRAEKFSDRMGSLCTALGIYKITGSFIGEHGLSFTLDGLESSNKNAESRGIIIHSAWYAQDDFIANYGRCGNSWGCPAISAVALKACTSYLKPGTLVWIYK